MKKTKDDNLIGSKVDRKVYQIEDNLIKRSPSAYRVWRYLISNMRNHSAVMASMVVLEEALDMSRATVFRGVKWLSDEGFITVIRSGSSNIFTLAPGALEAVYDDIHKHSQFSINVIVSESEQREGVDLPKGRAPWSREEVEEYLKYNQINVTDLKDKSE